MKKYGLLVILFLILLIFGILFFLNKDDDLEITETKKELVLKDYHKTEDEYYIYMEGKIKNEDVKDYSLVQIIFTTYDIEGNVNGNCIDNVSGLKKGEIWKFKAICTEEKENIAEYRVEEVAGY